MAINPNAGDRYQSTGYTMFLDYELDEHRDPTVERWRFRNAEEDGDDGEGWMIVTVREVVKTDTCGTLVVFHKQWFAPDGEPLSKRRRCIFGLPGFRSMLSHHTAKLLNAEPVA